ncbi:hypothetical protein E7681_02645 [Thalassobius vesicularis]|uniref:Uncharacterized protein n=1 Tax=Thalassobius vesicularis TaxID=1294297 RepID=A0A4V3UZG8_9RHOB|nr:polysaccharide deacetylase family protein [Thalassobius vesicularis]THD76755.1 hypothetical protein E7681_02645 [Thalassobius vesicularis]
MPGRLIISLDFELMWGVRDRRSVANYGDAIMGGRAAIPLMLAMFGKYQIRVTWATVGLLFARNRDEIRDYSPAIKPAYTDMSLSPYPAISTLGRDEQDDPLHFGRSLLNQIAQTPGQEVASHTFGHVYALEDGMTDEAWRADLQAAVQIAKDAGHTPSSLVFPRNQVGPEHIRIAREIGLVAYRGMPKGRVYRSRSDADLSLPVRALRFADGAIPLLGDQVHEPARAAGGALDVPASRFLRPWSARFPAYSSLHQTRIQREMRLAARRQQDYHLWWHPHNMGRNLEQNLSQLEAILKNFARLRDQYGMLSVNMADIAKEEGLT